MVDVVTGAIFGGSKPREKSKVEDGEARERTHPALAPVPVVDGWPMSTAVHYTPTLFSQRTQTPDFRHSIDPYLPTGSLAGRWFLSNSESGEMSICFRQISCRSVPI